MACAQVRSRLSRSTYGCTASRIDVYSVCLASTCEGPVKRSTDAAVGDAAATGRTAADASPVDADEAAAAAAIRATAGICADYPDWPEWQRRVRGRTADERLRALGL